MAGRDVTAALERRRKAKEEGTYKGVSSDLESNDRVSEALRRRQEAKENGTYESSTYDRTPFWDYQRQQAEKLSIPESNNETQPVTTSKPERLNQPERPNVPHGMENSYAALEKTAKKEAEKTVKKAKEMNLQSTQFDGLTNLEYKKYLDNLEANAKNEEQREWLQNQRRNLEKLKDKEVRSAVENAVFGSTMDLRPDTGSFIYQLSKNLDITYKEAESLFDTVEREQNAQHNQSMKEDANDLTDQGVLGKIGAHALSIGSNIVSGLGIVDEWGNNIENWLTGDYKPVDTNNYYYSSGDYRDRVRQNNADAITGKEKYAEEGKDVPLWREGLGLVYEGGASLLDSGLLAGAFGPTAAVTLLGTQAATGTTKDAFERTGSNEKALFTGTAAGLIEGLTEKYSIDKAWDIMKGSGKAITRNALANISAQTLAEGSEELTSEGLNALVDWIINREDSNYELNVQNYIHSGLSEDEARNQARWDVAKQMGRAGLVGAVSGTMSGGIATGANKLGQYAAGYDATHSEYDMYNATEKAKQYDDERVQNALKNYQEKPNSYNAGKLLYEMKAVDEIQANLAKKENKGKTSQTTENQNKGEISSPQMISESNSNQITAQKQTQPVNTAEIKARMQQATTADQLVEAVREVEKNGTQEEIEEVRMYSEIRGAQMVTSGMTTNEELALANSRMSEEEAFEAGARNEEVSPELLSVNGRIAYSKGKEAYIQEQVQKSTITNTKEVIEAPAVDKSGKNITISGIVSIEGEPTVKTSGGILKLGEINFQSEAVSALYNNASTMGSTKGASTYLKLYPGNMMVNAYDNMVQSILKDGELGLSVDKVLNRRKAAVHWIGEAGVKEIYALGKEKAESKNTQRTSVKRKGTGKAIDKTRSKTKEPLIKVFDEIAKKTGLDIEVSDKEMSNVRGYFEESMSRIVLNADENMFETVMHELGEFTDTWNTEGMEAFQTALLDWYFETYDSDKMHNLISATQKAYKEQEGSKSYREAANEIVNDAISGLFETETGMQDFTNWLSENRTETESKNILQTIADFLKDLCNAIRTYISEHNTSSTTRTTMEMAEEQAQKLRGQFLKAMDAAIANYQKAEQSNVLKNEDTHFSLVGLDENGIEVYETSEKTKKLTYAERKAKLLKLMKHEYAGRTAKFEKNGQVYYAQYNEAGVRKGIYGDKKSDLRGYNAKINIGADGNYIELAENALYSNSSAEQGKSNAFHKDAHTWDYYLKTIKSDGKYFNVLINVKDTGNGYYVYDITLKEATHQNALKHLRLGEAASNDSISEIGEKTTSKRNSLKIDTEGRTLTEEQREFFKDAKTVDAEGKLKPFYHGTGRADRVGYTFRADRATSGPMAYFTDSQQIADNYARDKQDTSIEYDEMYDDYYSQFRVEINGKNMSVSEAWNSLPLSKKTEIKEKAPHITMNDDYDSVIYDESVQYGPGGYDPYTLNMHKGNALEALTDVWLESGTIYGEEQMFLDVLHLVGIDDVQYMNPDFRDEKTYQVYLNITNPFETSNISEKMLDEFKMAAEYAEHTEGNSADMWDKRNIQPEEWIARLGSDIEDGTTNTWTSIPDFVTDVLKQNGYDGIFDTDEKNGGNTHMVAIPFYSNQIKEVTNQKPTKGNDDIRYSLTDTTDLSDFWFDNDNLEGTMSNAASILEEGTKQLQGKEVDPVTVRKIARDMAKEYKSKIDVDTFASNLEKVFSYLQTQEKANYDDMIRIMTEVAMPVIEESTHVDEVQQEIYKTFKKNLREMNIRLSNQQKDEVAHCYDSYENFRRRMFGTLPLSDKGINLDELWYEISEMSQGYLDSDVLEPEQPLALVEALEQMKPQMMNNFGANNEEVAMDLSLRIYEEYFKEQSDSKVKALQRKMIHERVEYHNKVRKEYHQKLANEKRKMKEKTGTIEKRVAEVKAAHKISELQKKYNQEATEYRYKIKKTGSELVRWIEKPTNKKHVPEQLKGLVLEFLDCIDFVSHRAKDDSKTTVNWRERMLTIHKELQNASLAMITNKDGGEQLRNFLATVHPEFMPRLVEFVEANESVNKISEMEYRQLKELDFLMRTMKTAVTKANELHQNELFRFAADAGESTVQELGQKKQKRPYSKLREWTIKGLSMDMVEPKTFMERMGEGATSVYQELRQGFNKRVKLLRQAQQYTTKNLENVSKEDLNKWIGDNAEVHMVETMDGKIRLSTGQIMGLYNLSKRNQGRNHILKGGVIATEVGKGSKRILQNLPVHVNQVQLAKIIDILSPEQKRLADTLQRFLATECAEWGNEVHMQMYEYKKFMDEKYWPIRTYSNQLRSKGNAPDEASAYAVKNLGFTNSTVEKAPQAIWAEDVMDTFVNHVTAMATYNAYLMPLTDAMKWFNYSNAGFEGEHHYFDGVRSAMKAVYGDDANRYFMDLLFEVNGETKTDPTSTISNKLASNFKKASVMGNLSVVIQQPTAYIRALNILDAKDLLGAFNGLTSLRKNVNEALEYSAIAQWKAWGFYETYMGQSMKQIITGQQTKLEAVEEKLSMGAQKADEYTWGILWNACKREVGRKQPSLEKGSQEFFETVTKRFDEVIDETQVVDTILHKSPILKSKGLISMEMAFMTEPMKSYNMMYRAGDKLAREQDGLLAQAKKGALNKKFGRSVLAWTLSGMLVSIAASLIYAFRDDKETPFGERYYNQLIDKLKDNLNPLNMIPFVKTAISMWQGYTSKRIDTEGAANVIYSIQGAMKKITNPEKSTKTWYGVAKQFAKGTSYLTGIPMYNVWRDTESLIEEFIGTDIREKETTGNLYQDIIQNETGSNTYENAYEKLEEKGKTEKDIRSGVRSKINSMFKSGEITESEAESILEKWGYDDVSEILEAWKENK